MSKNNTVGTKKNFAELPEVDITNKLTATEWNQVADFQKSPIQQETIFVDTSIVIDGTKEYSTTKVIAGATHTITAATSGHIQGNELRVRYQFDVDCTITLTGFDTSGNNYGPTLSILAGTYDFKFSSNTNGINLNIDGETITQGDTTIKKADNETYQIIRTDDTGGDWQELILNKSTTEFHVLNTTDGWLGSLEILKGFFNNNIGGATIFARDNDPITKLAGIACMADGTIMIGDLSNGTNRFSKMFFKHDYSAIWDALSESGKNELIFSHRYNKTQLLSKLDTADQSVAGDVEFLGNVLADKLAANVAAQLNALDVTEAAIGSGYGGIMTAPTNGMIVEGKFGLGLSDPDAKADILGDTTSDPLLLLTKTNASGGSTRPIFRITDQNDTLGYFQIEDSTGISTFLPTFRARADSTSPALFLIGDTYTGRDTGSDPLVRISARINNGTISNRPLLAVANVNEDMFVCHPDGSVEVKGAIKQHELSADPIPEEGQSIQWMSDGTGSGDDGDIMISIKAGGVTKTTILVDFSAI